MIEYVAIKIDQNHKAELNNMGENCGSVENHIANNISHIAQIISHKYLRKNHFLMRYKTQIIAKPTSIQNLILPKISGK